MSCFIKVIIYPSGWKHVNNRAARILHSVWNRHIQHSCAWGVVHNESDRLTRAISRDDSNAVSPSKRENTILQGEKKKKLLVEKRRSYMEIQDSFKTFKLHFCRLGELYRLGVSVTMKSADPFRRASSPDPSSRRTPSSPFWVWPPLDRLGERRLGRRSSSPWRWRIWTGYRFNCENWFCSYQRNVFSFGTRFLLGVFMFVVFGETAPFHQLEVDAAGLDGVDEFQYRQAAADLLILIDTNAKRIRIFTHTIPQKLYSRTLLNKEAFGYFVSTFPRWGRLLTLKLEILVDFPAPDKVLFTQFTMMSSFTFSPSPRSSRTFSVYLKEQQGTTIIHKSEWVYNCLSVRKKYSSNSIELRFNFKQP